jgi:glycosyltransferase involved in cell wall biosynthesis
LSAFVVCYNNPETIGTCLRALAFADEIVVVDKSSTDATPDIARPLADRLLTVPWSPVVEETRTFAAAQCSHDWILFLDDDECLSPEAVAFIDAELHAPRADIYGLPLRHYILGEHDERAYYWPEHQIRHCRRDAVEFTSTVHGGTKLLSDRVHLVSAEDGACIHHLSHRDTAQWIAKANRYTSYRDRVRPADEDADLVAFAHRAIASWTTERRPGHTDDYVAAVGVLRAVYDIIDRVKSWEERRGLDGGARFRDICAELDRAYDAQLRHLDQPRGMAGRARSQAMRAVAAELHRRDAEIAELREALGRLDAERRHYAREHERLEALLRAHDAALREQQRLALLNARLEESLMERDRTVASLRARVAEQRDGHGLVTPAP